MIILKTKDEIELMKRAGAKLSKVMKELRKHIKAGMSTKKIDDLAGNLIIDNSCEPAFKGYRGFPANICTSNNEEVVHGIPSSTAILKEGDILGLDLGLKLDGFFSDAAMTLEIGSVDPKTKKLLDVAKKSLYLGIKQAKLDNRVSDISWAIQSFVESQGFSVVRQFCGHGIGRDMHEDPEIPNYGQPGSGPVLKEGVVLAIEPMINMGTWEVDILDNGWTTVTKDRLPSAHFEHTVAVTKEGPVILTE